MVEPARVLAGTIPVFLILLTVPSVARADPIHVSFTTTFTEVSDAASTVLGFDVQPGQRFTGSVTFEVTGPDTSEDPRTAIFPLTGSMDLPFAHLPMQFAQVILNEANPALGDFVGFLGRDPGVFPGGHQGLFAVVAFTDPSGALLDSAEIPDVSVLFRFPDQRFSIATDNPFGVLAAGPARLVPEPATGLLAAAAAAALLQRSRRRRASDAHGR
jgi:hypothetical protein